jgi:hypothetical protein
MRIWQLGLLARDMAAGGARSHAAAPPARRRLAERIGRMHGLPEKIGQLLDLAEMLGPVATDRSGDLSPQRALPFDQAIDLLERSLGAPWSKRFRWIDPHGIPASLGQVHRALLLDGRAAAVKIQYPDSAADVATDLRALGWLTASVRGRRGFDRAAYWREIGLMLHRELDYRGEARALREFGAVASSWEGVVVPETIDELSSERILTMSWLEGASFDAVRAWPVEQRRQTAEVLLRLFLRSLFSWRRLHADPHPGNYRFLRSAQGVRVGLLDFGCVQVVDEAWARALAGLLEAARAGVPPLGGGRPAPPEGGTPTASVSPILAGYVALGFRPELLQPMAHLLPALNRVLFEPFATRGPFDLVSWKLSERVEDVLGEFRWNFRFAGPAKMIFVVRAYLGLLRYLRALDVAIDWSRAWTETRRQGDKETGRQGDKQEEMTRSSGDSSPCLPVSLSPCLRTTSSEKRPLSRHLRVSVREAGAVRVDLTFNAVLAESLDELMPDELEEKLQARRVDVRRIAADAVARQFAPGELFTLTEGSKQVRVWLE